MAIQNKFEIGGEAAIASYNFTDLAEGTGIVQYYGIRGYASGATIYEIKQSLTYPDTEHNGTIQSGDTPVNFDMSIYNLPKVIDGTLYITGKYVGGAAGNVSFIPQKVSGGVATDLATAQFSSYAATHSFFLKFTIPRTKFKKGDNLRIVAEVFGGVANEGLHVNSEDTTYPPLKIYIPYRIDL